MAPNTHTHTALPLWLLFFGCRFLFFCSFYCIIFFLFFFNVHVCWFDNLQLGQKEKKTNIQRCRCGFILLISYFFILFFVTLTFLDWTIWMFDQKNEHPALPLWLYSFDFIFFYSFFCYVNVSWLDNLDVWPKKTNIQRCQLIRIGKIDEKKTNKKTYFFSLKIWLPVSGLKKINESGGFIWFFFFLGVFLFGGCGAASSLLGFIVCLLSDGFNPHLFFSLLCGCVCVGVCAWVYFILPSFT